MTEVSFKISSEQHSSGATVIAVAGELDLRSSAVLRSSIIAAIEGGARHVILDMSAVTFIDSAGLGALVSGLRRLRTVDGELTLVCAERSIVRIFEITGLDWVFPLHPTLADALPHVPFHAAS